MQDDLHVDPGLLIRLLTEQRDLYLKLRALSERQRTMITDDQPEQLLNILSERHGIVIRLTRTNKELSPYRARWDHVCAQLAPNIRSGASGLLDEINRLLEFILRTDQEDSALLSARKQNVAERLGGVADGRAANNAYAAGGASTPPRADITV